MSVPVPDNVRGGFRTAWRKGWEARQEGLPRSRNPYLDLRTDRGSITFSRAWRNTWDDGWLAADREKGSEEG